MSLNRPLQWLWTRTSTAAVGTAVPQRRLFHVSAASAADRSFHTLENYRETLRYTVLYFVVTAVIPNPLCATSLLRVVWRMACRQKDFETISCGNFWPSESRDAYVALMALSYELAAVRDSARSSEAGELRFRFWQDFVDAAFAVSVGRALIMIMTMMVIMMPRCSSQGEQEGDHHPLLPHVTDAVHRYNLTKLWFDRMIEARVRASYSPQCERCSGHT